MQEVGGSWLMTAIAPSPVMVSLIQTAANLPYFLMGLIARALFPVCGASVMAKKRKTQGTFSGIENCQGIAQCEAGSLPSLRF